MKNRSVSLNNAVCASHDCAKRAASFAFLYAVRFFADCFFYFCYCFFYGSGRKTQRLCTAGAR